MIRSANVLLGEMVKVVIASSWGRTLRRVPLFRSQSLIEASSLPEASFAPWSKNSN